MRKFIAIVAFLIGFGGPAAFAQANPTPPVPVQHFVMSGSAASFGGNAVSIASAGVQLTTNISLVYEYISNPNDSSKPRVGSGIANYTRAVSTFVPASLKSKLLLDLSNYNVTFQGGAGVRSDAVTAGVRSRSIVGNFGIFGARPLPGGHTQIGLGYKFIVGKQTALVKVPVGTLNFTF